MPKIADVVYEEVQITGYGLCKVIRLESGKEAFQIVEVLTKPMVPPSVIEVKVDALQADIKAIKTKLGI